MDTTTPTDRLPIGPATPDKPDMKQRRDAIAAKLAAIVDGAAGWKTDADINAFFEHLIEVRQLALEWATAKHMYKNARPESVDYMLNRLLDAEDALFEAVRS